MKTLINPILKRKNVFVLIHVVFPILLGGLIYILFRSTTLIMFKWLDSIDVLSIVLTIRGFTSNIKNSFPEWFYYSLPDGLWVYSFTSALFLFNEKFQGIKVWLIIPLVLGPLFELLQFFKLFPGTFDITDLIFSSVAFILSILIFNYKNKKNDKQKQII